MYAALCAALDRWAYLAGLKFNVGPTKTAVVVARRGPGAAQRGDVPRCMVSGAVIPVVSEYKYLGVIMPKGGLVALQRATGKARLAAFKAKAAHLGTCGVDHMHPRVARELYFSEGRSTFLYAIGVWLDTSKVTLVKRMQQVQNSARSANTATSASSSRVCASTLSSYRFRTASASSSRERWLSSSLDADAVARANLSSNARAHIAVVPAPLASQP